MEVPVTVVPQRPKFIFDRSKVKNVIGQCFDQELSLRWQFVQLRAGKSLPFVVLPQLSRPPQHLDEEDPDEPIDGIYVIADELKSLHKDGELRLDGCTPDQIRLANALSEAWRLLHLGTVTDFPSKFSFRYRLTPDMAPTIMTEADYGPISANEIWKLQKLLEEFRYDWFLHHDKEARDRMKLSETRISELEVGMTRQHNSISKEYEAWAENIQVDPFILDDPFEKIPDVDTDCGWHAWFKLERQLLKEKRTLEIERRAHRLIFCDMLAAMTNGLISRGEIEERGPLTPGEDNAIDDSDGESDIYSAN